MSQTCKGRQDTERSARFMSDVLHVIADKHTRAFELLRMLKPSYVNHNLDAFQHLEYVQTVLRPSVAIVKNHHASQEFDIKYERLHNLS